MPYTVRTFLLLLFSAFLKLSAQENIYEPTFLSPNAANLYRLNSTPVSPYTGLLDFSIPIFEYNKESLGLNLRLAYSSSGNKVEDVASWVGLGWNISGIPSISRQVRGLPDEGTAGIMEKYMGKDVMYFSENYATNAEYTTFLHNTATEIVDTEADVFFISLPGYSGRFFYNQQVNGFVTESPSVIKIHFDPALQNFIVTDGNGTVYTYSIKETSRIDGASAGRETTNTWLAETIENVNKTNKITFQYNLEQQLSWKIGEHVKYIQFGPNHSPALQDQFGFVTSTVKSYLPSRIITNEGYVEFQQSLTEREDLMRGFNLEKIVVRNLQNELISSFNFFYSYATGSGENRYKSNKWMFLDSFYASDLLLPNNRNSYQFTYDKQSIPPSRLSFGQDYWGYYNGKVNNANLLWRARISNPFALESYIVEGSNRYVDDSYNQFGILKSVTYPTGGFSNFLFESNDIEGAGEFVEDGVFVAAEAPVDNPDPEYFLPNQNVFIAEFTINNPPNPQLNSSLGGSYVSANVAALGVPPGTPGASIRIRGKSPSNANINVLFYESFNSQHFPNGDYELKAEFDQNPANYHDFHCFLTWLKMGEEDRTKVGGLRIKQIETFSNVNKLALSKKYIYALDRFGEKSSGKVFSGYNLGNVMYHESHLNSSQQIGRNYYAKILASSSTQSVSQQSSVIGYDRVFEMTLAGGDSSLIKYDYINLPDENSYVRPFTPVQSFTVQNGKPMEETFYKFTNGQLDSVSKNHYHYDLNFDETTWYNLRRVDHDPAGGVIGYAIRVEYPGYYPYTFQSVRCNLLDVTKYAYSNGQPPQIESKSWTYNGFAQPIIYEENMSLGLQYRTKYFYPSMLAYTGDPESARVWLQAKNVVGKSLREQRFLIKNSTEHLLSTQNLFYKLTTQAVPATFLDKVINEKGNTAVSTLKLLRYDGHGNLLELQRENGPITTFLWGYNGQYPVAKIVNATYAEVLSILGQTAINNLNVVDVAESTIRSTLQGLRAHSSMQKSTVSDYTYKPLVGMSSMTDPRGITERYEYDGFQRLRDVFDFDSNLLRKYQYNYRP